MNTLYLRLRRKVIVPPGTHQQPAGAIAALQKNLECLGFALSASAAEAVSKLSNEQLDTFYQELITTLRTLVGAHVPFRPMYPDFPRSVMEMSAARLYLNALLHYLTNELPNRAKTPRATLNEDTERRVIELGSQKDFEQLVCQLAGAKTVLSPADGQSLDEVASLYRENFLRLLPPAIPQKENLATIAASLLRHSTQGGDFMRQHCHTATDVLRVCVALSHGDVSLAEPAKFGRFSRKLRRTVLQTLESMPNPTEDMLRWAGRWQRLGERLHPGEWADALPKTHDAFAVLRRKLPYDTFARSVERSLVEAPDTALALLASRPGELCRRLDHLLRSSRASDAFLVIARFSEIAPKVATPVLLQALTHFENRAHPETTLRVFFPKGDVGRLYGTEKPAPKLATEMAHAAANACEQALLARFRALPPLGACYLDPRLHDYLVPFAQRSAAKALRTLVRGCRLPLPDGPVLRFFLWWRNGKSRTDIDLSAALYGEACNHLDDISYYNLKSYGGCHSGDIVDAPEGAAEFIDLDMDCCRAAGVRYIIMSVNSYTQQPYCDLPECFVGWMSRQSANSGEIFEPRTVLDKVDLASNTGVCLPAIFDLQARKIIWCDIGLKFHPSWENNVRQNLSGVSLMLRAMLNLRKTTLHRLFDLHMRARGQHVETAAQAHTVFAVNEGITPFDLPRIAAEFL